MRHKVSGSFLDALSGFGGMWLVVWWLVQLSLCSSECSLLIGSVAGQQQATAPSGFYGSSATSSTAATGLAVGGKGTTAASSSTASVADASVESNSSNGTSGNGSASPLEISSTLEVFEGRPNQTNAHSGHDPLPIGSIFEFQQSSPSPQQREAAGGVLSTTVQPSQSSRQEPSARLPEDGRRTMGGFIASPEPAQQATESGQDVTVISSLSSAEFSSSSSIPAAVSASTLSFVVPTASVPPSYDNDSLEVNITSLISNCSESGVEEFHILETESGLGLWPILAITLSLVLLASLIATVTYLLYRHSLLWNRPQTLSDKCSNDESTGYIDDSAFRENSEELYSLDNDSFLNSLEAMTIQNYWTEHVKHTKL